MQRYSQNASMLPDRNGAYVSAKDAEELQRRLNEALKALATAEKIMFRVYDSSQSTEWIGRTKLYTAMKECRVCLDENKTAEPTWQPAEAEPTGPLTQAECVGKLGEIGYPGEQRIAEANAHHRMKEDFEKHMLGHQYGFEERKDAECWFRHGWRAGALYGLAMKPSQPVEICVAGPANCVRCKPGPCVNLK